ncbi:lysophospholipase [Hansschlegelia zhihuaiae]|uniref:Lysophospholipase n=1 Tax=Hansschlegelia zhihuaiae TaxID=405005 RepID=A0A4Q0M384_9HYPH|nr:lysophospholipase [Hansschlegelia zhihuaiae]RXF67026.1 lysophospholipase [Hansschlegelia zhihuaiae]
MKKIMEQPRHCAAFAAAALSLALSIAVFPSTAHAQDGDDATPAAGEDIEIPLNNFKTPLTLKDEGTFFLNGERFKAKYPAVVEPIVPGRVIRNQMYVHYQVPMNAKKLPVVMIHGGGLTGSVWEHTPDGREGWSSYFVRKGYTVYNVDIPGRGRSGFNPEILNEAKVKGDIDLFPGIARGTLNASWVNWRFGPEFGKKFPGIKFPTKNLDDLGEMIVPSAEVTVGGALIEATNGVVKLLDKIGPAILLVHSQSGPTADAIVGERPKLVKAVVNIEGSQNVVPTDDMIKGYKNVPDLELFGDNVQGNPASTGQPRFDARTIVANRINAAGGKAQVVELPSVGLRGNTHMVMHDTNSLKVADYILGWLEENTAE